MIRPHLTCWPAMAIEMALYRHAFSPDCEDCEPDNAACSVHLRACEVCGSLNAMNDGAWTNKKDNRGNRLTEVYCDACWEKEGT